MPIPISHDSLQHTTEQVYRYMLLDHTDNWGMDIQHWDWVPGVGVIAILSYYENTHDQEVLDYLTKWAYTNIPTSEQASVINAMAPFAIFPALYEYTQDSFFLEESLRVGQWMLTEAPRTREGAFEHTVTENVSFPEQVWADTIFMAVLFLARLARVTGDNSYAIEAVKQLEIHLELLEDPDTGVMFHGWNCMALNHMSGARWTRANAWIAVGTPMIMQELTGIATLSQQAIERYSAMMHGLIRYQQANGLWATVMDRPDFYPETSGSAGIACGILQAIRLGLIDSSYETSAFRSLKAILHEVLPNGEVTGVSGGTPVMSSIEAYNEIPCHPTLYGQGLVLMLLSEIL
ncbi:glycoside hydrolase family 88/105 protein [Paenibacillus macquariensis]|uniref:Unsaturated rhamnogalacturonyl hydrolase n=1 Tax=Paenibacillus macquariensis TaxID=948756 RepID=A0ABY1KGJ8_9BACL|nr:glycoside hydrolase family 88 protein [Paenibacillus macquariensis]MEC0093827.1 glycoside hydrolase family 88 protein [Paenibacillus macquariensis]OAB33610.1 glycosyl hydrolase [Paenibacillus macquariensis subsp. macquariensis]SIR67422.1 unsaturated rhamnogalacturonyl hydrolase [Paenibacillus macquariensis]